MDLRIAQVNVYFYPHMVGGVEWYVYNISRGLVRLGHEVDVLTCNGFSGGKEDEPFEEIDGVGVHRLELALNLSYRAKIWRGLKDRLMDGGYDIIHTYDYAQPHTFTAAKVGEALNLPVALTVFDIHSIIPRRFWKSIPMKFFDRFFAPPIFRKVKSILLRAPNLLPYLLRMGAPSERVWITPSGVLDEALNSFDGRDFLSKHSIDGSPIILYVGRLHPMKGPQHLLMATEKVIRRCPNAQFVLVGPEQDGFGSRLKEMSRQLGVSSHIHLIGPVYDFEEKMDAYACCDIFTLPSGYEGTSQAIFEAMAQGKPIVSTKRGGIPSQVEDGVDGILVEYGDVEALASSIIRLSQDRELASGLGKNGRRKMNQYTYSHLVKALDSIYSDMIREV